MNIRSFETHYPQIQDKVYIDPTALLIGRLTLEQDVSIWPGVIIRADVNKIHIGAKTNIQDSSVLHVSRPSPTMPEGYPLYIGSETTIGHRVTLHGCQIGSRVLVGIGSTVLDGALIADDVMIGAGSLIPPGKHLASGYLYLGTPVKQIRALSPEEIAGLAQSAAHYVNLKNSYLQALN